MESDRATDPESAGPMPGAGSIWGPSAAICADRPGQTADPPHGLIHHADSGGQFCLLDCQAMLCANSEPFFRRGAMHGLASSRTRLVGPRRCFQANGRDGCDLWLQWRNQPGCRILSLWRSGRIEFGILLRHASFIGKMLPSIPADANEYRMKTSIDVLERRFLCLNTGWRRAA